VTFVGEPEAVQEAAFRAIAKAAAVLDMRRPQGRSSAWARPTSARSSRSPASHGRLRRMAAELGQRVADELGIPVYLYEGGRPEAPGGETWPPSGRRIRGAAGEAQGSRVGAGISVRPSSIPRSGATIIGAAGVPDRLTIQSQQPGPEAAHEIALEPRESAGPSATEGREHRQRTPGQHGQGARTLQEVKSVAGMSRITGGQVRSTFTNYRTTPIQCRSSTRPSAWRPSSACA